MNKRICHSCAVVAVNGDDSHLSAQQATKVNKRLERLGNQFGYPEVDTFDERAGFGKCDVCGNTTYAETYGLVFA